MTLQEQQIAALACAIVGVCLLLVGGWLMMRVRASRDWLSVEGTIVSSRIERERGDDPDDYRAFIEYEYIINGQLFHSRRVRLVGNTETGEHEARRLTQRYPKGSRVTVYFDPRQPTRATLERNQNSPIPLITLALGAIFIAAALGLLISLTLR